MTRLFRVLTAAVWPTWSSQTYFYVIIALGPFPALTALAPTTTWRQATMIAFMVAAFWSGVGIVRASRIERAEQCSAPDHVEPAAAGRHRGNRDA